ncbi:MAG: RNA-splicing ligase RtcB [Elusimicrobia bacterium CG1_02_37_114]|nr:MAG: RNA-splicing ligase RtcB [Elusimicrobia bacterium CG1_02_37_114]PIV52981.1 MAG: RNA-splicing ligase RtcB [Elusimicrobia bacterium CG02_land_8_20_14_3_00_37_13]PIZ14332.1 MAG: RNA-splicing ligase RtcB [Elusimicrobia bacterium CG_4_10_14_0_8_um_filter_37_32]
MTEYHGLKKIDDWRWLMPKSGGMRTEGMIYASEKMLEHIVHDKASNQVSNVTYLPGIVGRSLAMPDIHWGYGFPIGGVAGFDYDTGVISPGGIGYDINCGVRLLRTNLELSDVSPKLEKLISTLFTNIPSGVGSTGKINLNRNEVMKVLEEGSKWSVKKGFGNQEDLSHTEDQGQMSSADPSKVSQRALERGREQLGTLGAGNHFLEIQVIDEVYDEQAANSMGLFKGQVTIMIHTGSRGLGYQVCDDYIKILQNALKKYNISIPDRQLVCAPVTSDEGKDYFSAMSSAANYAWANRQCITHWTRESFMQVMGMSPKDIGLELVYDVAHNIGKIEEHNVEGKKRKLIVHRKGATRAFPGQPVIIPGSMGTNSYVLVGTQKALDETWGSTCHGAGRTMSRTEALRRVSGGELKQRLAKEGIIVQAREYKTLAEEAPEAYKDVNMVVEVCHQAGISKKVVRMSPVGVIKG